MRNPMTKFEVLIGTWNATGVVLETASHPPGTLIATDTYRWLPGKHFIVHDVDARFDLHPIRSIEIIGFDSRKRRYVATSYGDRGTIESTVIELNGRRVHIKGDTTRFDGSFDATRHRLTGLWEIKSPKARWQPWIEFELVRA